MKYALLIYTDPDSFTNLSEADQQSISAEYFALRDEPSCIDGAQLQPIDAATTVRVQGGQTLTTDGPFAETKEAFAGYYLFELDHLDAALEMAARIPAARMGGAVEVRPLVEYPTAVEG
jgi:hypothetical protein